MHLSIYNSQASAVGMEVPGSRVGDKVNSEGCAEV